MKYYTLCGKTAKSSLSIVKRSSRLSASLKRGTNMLILYSNSSEIFAVGTSVFFVADSASVAIVY